MDEKTAIVTSVNEFGRFINMITENQWHDPTPNKGWNVTRLVAHGLEGVAWIPDILAGKTIHEVGDAFSGDLLGSDPKGAWNSAAAKIAGAISAVDLERNVHLSYGEVTARKYLQDQTCDLTVHAWDLARSIGAEEVLDQDLVLATYGWFEPMAEEWRAAGLIGPAVPVPPDASVQIRLIGLSGRQAVLSE